MQLEPSDNLGCNAAANAVFHRSIFFSYKWKARWYHLDMQRRRTQINRNICKSEFRGQENNDRLKTIPCVPWLFCKVTGLCLLSWGCWEQTQGTGHPEDCYPTLGTFYSKQAYQQQQPLQACARICQISWAVMDPAPCVLILQAKTCPDALFTTAGAGPAGSPSPLGYFHCLPDDLAWCSHLVCCQQLCINCVAGQREQALLGTCLFSWEQRCLAGRNGTESQCPRGFAFVQ